MNRRRTVVIRNRYFAVSDLLLTALSAILGFAVRLDAPLFGEYLPICLSFVVLAIVIKLPVYYLFGLYRCYWRYAGGKELRNISQRGHDASDWEKGGPLPLFVNHTLLKDCLPCLHAVIRTRGA